MTLQIGEHLLAVLRIKVDSVVRCFGNQGAVSVAEDLIQVQVAGEPQLLTGGENIAIGTSGSGCNTAAHVFEMWQENDDDYSGQGHRRAMLSSGYKAIGIAYVQYKGVHCWVQEFGTKNSGAAATTALVGTTTGTVRLNTSKAFMIKNELKS